MSLPDLPSPDGVYRLSAEEQRTLAWALLSRPQRSADGLAAFRARYPAAPDEMLRTAAHHVYTDGPDAVIQYLADAELALRDPQHEIGAGPASEVAYHLYNWLQFQALVPRGTPEILALLGDLKRAVAEDDRAFVLHVAQALEDALEGSRLPPDVESP